MYKVKFFALIIASAFFAISATLKHPLHVSTTEVNVNQKEKTLEISCRIFSDDFESILAKNYKQKIDLSKPAMKAAMDAVIQNYVTSHLQIKANGKLAKMNYLGFEIDHEATNIYLEVEKIPALKRIDLTNTLLYDLFDDQMSIIHIVKGQNRKSGKVLYPDRNFTANLSL